MQLSINLLIAYQDMYQYNASLLLNQIKQSTFSEKDQNLQTINQEN